ncbi:MAG: glycerol-3-phosphate dehydrogenase [NAD(P)+] [Bacteroidia bacterium]|nr:MAG: glycerol-3-phosphate dehydrogenase [NAD(P)+] [Bacteroidia bacterium]
MTVGLIGAGSWGCALAAVLLEKGHRVRWWVHKEEIAQSLIERGMHPSVFPEYVFPPAQIAYVGTRLKEVWRGAEAIVLALPSRYVPEVLEEEPLPARLWVSCTKGLLPGGLLRPSQYLREKGVQAVVILSGPSHAEEVILRKPTWVAVGTPERSLYERGAQLFSQPYFHLLWSRAWVSLEWVGVLKNIYAIGMGVVSLWGDNARAALAAVALREMQEVLQMLVPEEEPPFLSPGWTGDFLVTAFSPYSRNQRFGQLLAQGYTALAALQKLGMVAEGYYAAQSLASWAEYRRFPLLRAVVEAIQSQSNPSEVLRQAVVNVMESFSDI